MFRLKKYAWVIILVALASNSWAQSRVVQNLTTFDQKPLHFGYRLGIVGMDIDAEFNPTSQIRGDITGMNWGFAAGLIASLRINRYMNLRALPGLALGERVIKFNGQGPDPIGAGSKEQFTRKSTYVELPLNLKVKTRRINNYRPYFMAGVAYRFDIAKKRDDDMVQLSRHNLFLEAGIGLDYYFQFFRYGTELKFSLGINNLLGDTPDPTKQVPDYHDAFKSLNASMVTLSFFFE
ncbi:PorT family protein [Prolixibacteraceae bacterium JC049]|nr:PorT family protein [Prolixibacteraceae bacterium JC049]